MSSADNPPPIDTTAPAREPGSQGNINVNIWMSFTANDENYWCAISVVAFDPKDTVEYRSEARGATGLDPGVILADLLPDLKRALGYLTPMV